MGSAIAECNRCGKRYNVPSATANKRRKCRECGGVVSAVDDDADDYELDDDDYGSSRRSGQRRRSKECPACGTRLPVSADECRECGEYLDDEPPRRRSAGRSSGRSSRPDRGGRSRASKARGGKQSGELTPAEYIVATLFCPIGLVIGIVWSSQHNNKSRMMLMVSSLCLVVAVAGSFSVWYWNADSDDSDYPEEFAASMRDAAERQHQQDLERQIILDELLRAEEESGRGRLQLETKVDLEGQPPEIQAAFRANVRIEMETIVGRSMGSGVVIQKNGTTALIITNRHVIDEPYVSSQGTMVGETKDILPVQVTWFNQQSVKGDVIWTAPDAVDLALVSATCPDEVQPVEWRPVSQPATGEDVFAVGNPVGLGWTYTRGVVSALRVQKQGNAEIPIIQTDATINSGSSGGGLYNKSGHLIGINSFIVNPNVAAGGLGFAIRTQLLDKYDPEALRGGSPTAAGGDGSPAGTGNP